MLQRHFFFEKPPNSAESNDPWNQFMAELSVPCARKSMSLHAAGVGSALAERSGDSAVDSSRAGTMKHPKRCGASLPTAVHMDGFRRGVGHGGLRAAREVAAFPKGRRAEMGHSCMAAPDGWLAAADSGCLPHLFSSAVAGDVHFRIEMNEPEPARELPGNTQPKLNMRKLHRWLGLPVAVSAGV